MVVKLSTLVNRGKSRDMDVEEAEGKEAMAKVNAETARKARNENITEIRQRIIDGETTGDIALDIKICVEYTFEKDITYENLFWLNDQMAQHPGELIALCHGSLGRNLSWVGVLPEDAKLPLHHRSYGRLHEYKIGIPMAQDLSADANARLTIRYLDLSHDDFADFTGSAGVFVVIGNEMLQQWLYLKADTYSAYTLWMASKTLGRELKPTEAVFADYMSKREILIPQIVAATTALNEFKKKFERYQAYPAEAIKDHEARRTGTTATGVTIEFKIVDEIEKSKRELNNLLDRALDELHMHDNMSVKEACRAVGRTLDAPAST